MPSTDYITSFIEQNSAMLDTLRHSIEDEAEETNQLRIVYHSVPMSCLLDKDYQSEVLTRLAGSGVTHIFDCGEANPVEINKVESLTFAR